MHTTAIASLLLKGVLAGVTVFALAIPPPLRAAPAPPAELTRAMEIFNAEVARIASQHNEFVKTLPRQYQADLADMQKKLQESGDLDGMLAMENEAKRFAAALDGERDPFESVPEMPEGALVEEPAVLRTMQETYLKRYRESADLRSTRLQDLTKRYIANLSTLQKDLTRKGSIADAVSVRQEVERLRKSSTNEQFVSVLLAMLPEGALARAADELAHPKPEATNSTPAVYGNIPSWAKWEWEKTDNYAQEGYLFAHPDLPDELGIEFNPKTGRGRVTGRCYVDRMVVDMRERAWFGKAIAWRIADAQNLNATFHLQSKELSIGQNNGPAAQLVLFSDKTPLLTLTVNLMAAETTLRVVKDPQSNRCALLWVQGNRMEKAVLPATGVLRLLFAITVRNPGERCDTVVAMQ